MKQILIGIIFTLLVAGPVPSLAQDQAGTNTRAGDRTLEGVIIKVISAGELVLWEADTLYPFTLYGVKWPALDTALGIESKKKISELVFNKLLTVHLTNIESDPPQGIVIIQGECINKTLVSQGLARVRTDCRKTPYCSQWQMAETQAKTANIGIWKCPD
jgi:hypothetical protein